MKLTSILVLVLATGAAWAQNPDLIQNTRNTLQAVEQKKANDSNAALAASQGQPAASTTSVPAAKPTKTSPAAAPAAKPAKTGPTTAAGVKSAKTTPVVAPVVKPAQASTAATGVKSAKTTPVVAPAVKPVQASTAATTAVKPAKTSPAVAPAVKPAQANAGAIPAVKSAQAKATSGSAPIKVSALSAGAKPQGAAAKKTASPTVKPAPQVMAAPKAAAKPKAPKAAVAPKESPAAQKVEVKAQANPDATKDQPKAINLTGRRDPFVSPVVNRSMVGSGCSTGKKCLAIDQINLKGVVKSDAGMIAVVVNAMNKAYFLRENDPVFNGYVVKITGDSIVFKETIQDKLGKPFTREVTKKITTSAV
jgi:Tfp pilus assembly protein PilP